MADPVLTKSSVQVAYKSSDGYAVEIDYTNRGAEIAEPHQMLLDGFAELARILALFGFEQQARNAAFKSFDAIRTWRENRSTE